MLSRAVARRALRGIYRRLLFRGRTAILKLLLKGGKVAYLPSSTLLRSDSLKVIAYRGPEEICFEPPISSREDSGLPHQPFIGTWHLPAPWYAIFPDANLVGDWAAGLSSGGEIIAETITPEASPVKFGVVPVTHLRRAMDVLASREVIHHRAHDRPVCSMVGVWSRGYYHWLIDYLPRLEAVEACAFSNGAQPTLVIDSDATEWQIESLALLGYGAERTIVWKGGCVQIHQLLVPSFPTRFVQPDREFSAVSPRSLEWLSSHLRSTHSAESDSGHRRLYVSRARSPGRRVVNEEEVVALLATRGFEAVDPGQLTFSEQVRLFASAEAIVGPHGASLTNLIFGSKVKVVELYGSYWNRSFYSLSMAKGFAYGTLRCKPRFTLHPYRHDMFVPLDDLTDVMDRMDL